MKQTAYFRVYTAILNDLKNGVYSVGDKLPSESELEKQYHVSRTTVRKAVELLVQDGLLHVKQGFGTEVIDRRIKQNYNYVTSFTQTLTEKGYHVTMASKSVFRVRADSAVAAALCVQPGMDVFCLCRVVKIDGRPIGIMKNYICIDLVPDMDRYTDEIHSFYNFLEKKYNLVIENAHDIVTARNADFEQSCVLECDAGAALIYTRRICYRGGKPLCYDVVHILSEVKSEQDPSKVIGSFEIDVSLVSRNEKVAN